MRLERLIHHQIRFVSMAMGKPPLNYSDAGLHSAHASRGITKASFDLIVALFIDALVAEDIEPDDTEQILSVLRASLFLSQIKKPLTARQASGFSVFWW